MQASYTVCYMNFEGGFWGLVSEDDQNYFPINYPEQLKYADHQVNCKILLMKDVMTTHGWGIPCKILSFQTVSPLK